MKKKWIRHHYFDRTSNNEVKNIHTPEIMRTVERTSRQPRIEKALSQESKPTLSHHEILIGKVENLLRPETIFRIGDLHSLQQESVNFLLELGSEFDEIRKKVEAIKFEPTANLHPGSTLDPARRVIVPTGWSKEKCEAYIAQELNALKTLLTIAKNRADRNQGRTANPQQQPTTAERSPLSENDEWLHKLIGPEAIKNSTNAELWKQYGPTLKKKKPSGYKVTAFRARLDRIRRRYGYPTSSQVQKIRLKKILHNNQC